MMCRAEDVSGVISANLVMLRSRAWNRLLQGLSMIGQEVGQDP